MKKWLIATFVISVLAVPIYFLSFSNDVSININSDNIQYSEELGWINWKHAIPDGTRSAYLRFQNLNSESKDSFAFSYKQSMKYRILNTSAIAEFSETHNVRGGLSASEEQVAFFEIFQSVSASFENMQANLLFRLVPGTNASSFREGDLMGNLISFYIAVNNLRTNTVKDKLTLYDAEKSLKILKSHALKRIEWLHIDKRSLSFFNDTEAVFESIFLDDSALSRVVLQTEKFYLQ